MTLPEEVALENLTGGRELETTMSVTVTAALSGTRVRVGRSHPTNPGMDVVLTTARGAQAVTMLLLLAPLALYLAVVFRLSREVRSGAFSGAPELGIASGLIGLIPVRAALVREGLEVLTMVDYVLAAYVVLFLGTAAVEVVMRTKADSAVRPTR